MSTLFIGKKDYGVSVGCYLKKCDVRLSQAVLLTAYLQQDSPGLFVLKLA